MSKKRRKPKGTGVPGIKKLGPERFHVVVTWSDPKTGRRRKKEGIAESLEEAVVLRAKLKREPDEAPAERIRISEFAPQWLEAKREDIEKSTFERYSGGVAHITARFGDYWVDAVDADDIEGWLEAKMRDGKAAATVNSWLRIMRCLLDGAIRAKLRSDNPARSVRVRKEGRTRGRRGRALTAEQLQRFIRTAMTMMERLDIAPDVGRMLQVMAWTGVRRGEALALRWSDLIEGELHVTRAVSAGEEKTTKTDDPRIVGIPEPLAMVFVEQRAWLHEVDHPGAGSGLMFPASPRHAKAEARRRNQPISWIRTTSCLDKPLRAVVKKSGVPDISLHSFRRTYENLLRRAGVDEHVRRTVAGWRSSATQAIYAGVDPSERKDAAMSLERLVFSPQVTVEVTLDEKSDVDEGKPRC